MHKITRNKYSLKFKGEVASTTIEKKAIDTSVHEWRKFRAYVGTRLSSMCAVGVKVGVLEQSPVHLMFGGYF